MPKKKSSTESSESSPSFEQAMQELQEIVSQLEDGHLGLDESLTQFERGTNLLKSCHTVLEQAEQKIELLTGFRENGSAETEPFDSSSTLDQQSEKKAGRRKSRSQSTSSETEEENGQSESTLF